MELILLRHAATKGNLMRRYIGVTDEKLSPEGEAAARRTADLLPKVQAVYASPLLRCQRTAEILFPGHTPLVLLGFRETDFGRFENKSYEDLKNDREYQNWIDSGGSLAFPGGESTETVKRRVLQAFDDMVLDMEQKNIKRASAVVHGGTIMALLSERACPKRSFYDWQVGNCEGFMLMVLNDHKHLELIGELKADTK
ncbi:MAG: histidine phosphatase family protein [Clostridiales bacterium]|jgi:alpha-ribazole phosphatase|nr:histidine phosphatase family protein [Clostridiales bacterium]